MKRASPSARRLLLLVFAWALAACAATSPPGDYAVASVPDITEVGAETYMAWFEDHAVTDETRAFIAPHGPALEATLAVVDEARNCLPDCRVTTRRDPRRHRPALKQPHKVEEKIYRMLLESEANWVRYHMGEGEPGCFPEGATPLEARRQVFSSDPRDPCALRDIAGLRIIVPDLATVREFEARLRKAYGERIIRFKDYIGKQYRGDGYRSVHLVVLENGLPVEIQLRTRRQQWWAKWEHSLIYKGRFKDNESAHKYAREVADRLYRQDQGRCEPPCPLPDCPDVLRDAGRCFQEPAVKPPAP